MNQKLADLSWQAFKEADLLLQNGDGKSAAILHETALVEALLSTTSMRPRTLLALDIADNFERDQDGTLSRILVDGRKVKSHIAIRMSLPESLAERIDRHLKTFRPILLRDQTTTALFLWNSGKPLHAASLLASTLHRQ
jgi:hypothetical protein